MGTLWGSICWFFSCAICREDDEYTGTGKPFKFVDDEKSELGYWPPGEFCGTGKPFKFSDVKTPEKDYRHPEEFRGTDSPFKFSEDKNPEFGYWPPGEFRGSDKPFKFSDGKKPEHGYWLRGDFNGPYAACENCGEREPLIAWQYNEPQEHIDPWEIPRASLNCIRKIGQGHFAEDWQGSWNNTTPVAIKTCKQGSKNDEIFLAEAHVMKYLRHVNVIQLYGVCTQIEPFCIIHELMTHGSLLYYLRDRRRTIEIPGLIYIAAQVASGMAYLESIRCIHRDLAAISVLMGRWSSAKIHNFALARLLEDDEDEYVAIDGDRYPVRWTAPESISSWRYTIQSDVWSFGILLAEIITRGRLPYSGMTDSEVIDKVEEGYRMPASPNCPQGLYDIMNECWEQEATERPTFPTLKNKLELLYS